MCYFIKYEITQKILEYSYRIGNIKKSRWYLDVSCCLNVFGKFPDYFYGIPPGCH